MDIKKYIKKQLSDRYEDLETMEDILRDMKEEMIDERDFYDQTKDFLIDQTDKKLLEKEFNADTRLGEEIILYEKYVRHDREVLDVLEELLTKYKN